ncbi:hypothetical protein C2845_PM15G21270 [Panicum miliaceum]|uniref:Uncharacterized protein n=1 Tax=Panicum miliaceum TaxID=4540 RepID=A0A3L6QBT6_PANMI|nr:hypothetical protein C2845_PM15G21270 [Panicum miliaceum]
MNWFQAAQPALLCVAPGVIGLVAIHWLWNGEDGTNQLMGKVWNWNNMCGTKLKKFDGWVLRTTNEDGNGGEDDAAALPEDHEGSPEDGYGGEEDAAAPLEEEDGDQDDRGAALEDGDDDIQPLGLCAVQLLAIRAINGYDSRLGRCIYRQHERERQESCSPEGMVDSVTRAGNTTTTGDEGKDYDVCGFPIRVDWDVCSDDGGWEPEEYTQTIYCLAPCRKVEITYLVIPNAIETNVEFKLKLKDLGSARSRAVYGKIKASTADYGNKSVHLFSCERGRSWSVPSGPTSILPLSPAVIALPYRRQLQLTT